MASLGSPSLRRSGHFHVPDVLKRIHHPCGMHGLQQQARFEADESSCRPILRDHPAARTTEEAIAHLYSLQVQSLGGAALRPTMLTTFMKMSSNNHLELLLDRAYFAAMLPALLDAQDSIHIAMLTFDDSPLGQAVADLLIHKKLQTPKLCIRVIYDGYGSSVLRPFGGRASHFERLRAAGIELCCNNVFQCGLEHRKLVLIDGRLAFVGGVGIGKEYY
ncbi:MAG: hypothetical protein EOO40_06410, partial [Deltaproteobacteria bacterium]